MHKLIQADITSPGALDALGIERVDAIYSDPPWGPGNLTYWRTMNGEDNRPSWPGFLESLSMICARLCPDGPVWIESGLRWEGEVREVFERAGLAYRGRFACEYKAGSKWLPNVLLLFGAAELPMDTRLEGERHGIGLVKWALSKHEGRSVLDPCSGLGTTARAAIALGRTFYGSELSPKRMARTQAILDGAKTPKRKRTVPPATIPLALAKSAPAPGGDALAASVRGMMGLPVAERIAAYNAISAALGDLVRDVSPDPAVSPRLLPAAQVQANDYNPNRVASVEMDLLENSIRADGITMAVVVVPDGAGGGVVVDGFHRRTVAAERLQREYIPCAVLDRPMADRMASTVRHNRARGKHQVDLMASIVKAMMGLGWEDAQIAENLGMSVEELLRLRQMVGAAKLLAAEEYTREWAPIGSEEDA